MEEIFQKALEKMIEEVNGLIEELNQNPLFERINQKKKLINEFSLNYGGGKIYEGIESGSLIKSSSITINPGQYKGMTLAKAVRNYMNVRGKENPPTYDDILNALKMGDFDQKKISDIRSALLKNNQICLLRDNHFGLVEWYDKSKRKSNKESAEDQKEEMDSGMNDAENTEEVINV